MDRLWISRALHERVRGYIARVASSALADDSFGDESFDAIGLAIARFQAEHVPAYQRLLRSLALRVEDIGSVRELPAVPTDAFRLTRVAAHPKSEDAIVFRTSGTTGAAAGEHALSNTLTYEHAALAWGEWALFPDQLRDATAIIFAPPVDASDVAVRGASSLHFMIDLFAARFCAVAHHLQSTAVSPIERRDIVAACDDARRRGRPAVLLGTSFAFVHALDALVGVDLPASGLQLPPGSRAMLTGGFKGRSRVVEPTELRARLAAAFGLPLSALSGEYGMTELSSQLYERTLRHQLGLDASGSPDTFVPPPWMRVVAVDPDSLRPLPDGETGILRFEDLANVDSALVVQTADRGRCTPTGVVLLGRYPGATPRGCSLAIEDLLGP